MTAWSKSQFKRLTTQLAPPAPAGGTSRVKKVLKNEIKVEESERELREYIDGSYTRRIKRKTGDEV